MGGGSLLPQVQAGRLARAAVLPFAVEVADRAKAAPTSAPTVTPGIDVYAVLPDTVSTIVASSPRITPAWARDLPWATFITHVPWNGKPARGVEYHPTPRVLELFRRILGDPNDPSSQISRRRDPTYLIKWMDKGFEAAVARFDVLLAASMEENEALAVAKDMSLEVAPQRQKEGLEVYLAWLCAVPRDESKEAAENSRFDKAEDGSWRYSIASWATECRANGYEIRWPVIEYLAAHNLLPPNDGAERRALTELRHDNEWVQMAQGYDRRVRAAELGGTPVSEVVHPIYEDGPLVSSARSVSRKDIARVQAREKMKRALLHVPDDERDLGFFEVSDSSEVRVPLNPVERDVLKGSEEIFAGFYDARWRTRFVTRVDGVVPGKPGPDGVWRPYVDGILLLLSGAGCEHSHLGAMTPTGSALLYLRDYDDRQIKNAEGYPRSMAVVAVDHPWHGGGPRELMFNDLNHYLTWLDSIVEYLRSFNLPIVALGRSTGANVLLEYASRYDGRLAGAIAMSGYAPEWSPFAINYIKDTRLDGVSFDINYPGLSWVLGFDGWPVPVDPRHMTEEFLADLRDRVERDGAETLRPQWTFHSGLDGDIERMQTADPDVAAMLDVDWGRVAGNDGVVRGETFADNLRAVRAVAGIPEPRTKGMILYGGMDGEYPRPAAQYYWQKMAAARGHRLFVNHGAGHDHFNPQRTPKEAITPSLRRVRKFIREAVLNSPPL